MALRTLPARRRRPCVWLRLPADRCALSFAQPGRYDLSRPGVLAGLDLPQDPADDDDAAVKALDILPRLKAEDSSYYADWSSR